jgi:hypothetical protein
MTFVSRSTAVLPDKSVTAKKLNSETANENATLRADGDAGAEYAGGPLRAHVLFGEVTNEPEGTVIVEVEAAEGNILLGFSSHEENEFVANRGYRRIITYTDESTETYDNTSGTVAALGGLWHTLGGNPVRQIDAAKKVEKVRYEKLNTGTGWRRIHFACIEVLDE